MSRLLDELRQAARRLSRSPIYATLAMVTLAAGIGINTAMTALVDALLFRPPSQVAEPARVVRLRFRIQDGSESAIVERTHYPNFTDLKRSAAFEALAAYSPAVVSVGAGPDAVPANAMLVSDEFFRVLQPTPLTGRVPALSTDAAGDGRALVSYGFWQQRFGGEPTAIGAKLTIDGRLYSVEGILPRGFHSLTARATDIWLPLDHAVAAGVARRGWRDTRGAFWIGVIGRLADGASRSIAEQQATAALRDRRVALGGTGPFTEVVAASLVPGRGDDKSLENRVSLWLAGVSTFVLLIACANVANLVLTRAVAQRREHFIRVSLGASRYDLVSRCLADTLVIVGPAAVGALVVLDVLRNVVSSFVSADVPLPRELWDGRTAGIMLGSTGLASVLICAAALSQLRTAAAGLLVQVATERVPRPRTRRILLAAQAALSLTLLAAAGLFAVSLHRAQSLDLGAAPDRTIQITMNLGSDRRDGREIRAIYEQAQGALARHPDVERVSLAEGSPYKSGSGAGPWTAERSAEQLWAHREEVAYRSAVGAGFFSTTGATSLRGRDFTVDDGPGAPAVAIINAPLAKYLWPSRDALGQCMRLDQGAGCLEVVGVLGGVWKFSALKRDKMAVYLPLAQVPTALPGVLFVRPRGDARRILPQLRSMVQAIRSDLPAARIVLLREIVDPEFRPWRLGATVFSAFAVVALLIAAVGLYAVVTASSAFRRKEIGIRRALGARWPHVIAVVGGEGLACVSIGLVGGAALVLLASRWLGTVLFETSPRDSTVLAATGLILLVVSALAMLVPTVRALAANPAAVLRSE